MPVKLPLELLAEELGNLAGRIERDAGLRITAALADMRRLDAERELRFTNLERRLEERLSTVRDGDPGEPGRAVTLEEVTPVIDAAVAAAVAALPAAKDGDPGRDADPAAIEEAVTRAVAALPKPENGRDADPAEIERMVAAAVAALPAPRDGADADPDVIRAMVSEEVAKLPPPAPGAPGKDGKLPIARAWSEKVHYEGEVVTLDGSTYQAVCDTGRAPPHDDWVCLAAAGRDGADGRTFTIRGTHVEGTDYAALDVVVLNGGSFVARRDNPGPCPGDGWQLIASQGKRGNPGEAAKSVKGDPGPAGPPVVAMTADDQGLVTLTNADGSTVECDLYPLLAKISG